jgi:GcrA cell cycle regulator
LDPIAFSYPPSLPEKDDKMSNETKPSDHSLFLHDEDMLADGHEPSHLPALSGNRATGASKRVKKMVTTLTLSSRTCRWPLGDPAKEGFHYCGVPPQSGRPYCDEHGRMSYQAAPRKKVPPSFR